MSVDEVLAMAATFYDLEYHLRLVQEECGELTAAVNHYLRADRPEDKEERLRLLREEVTDVHKCTRILWRLLGENDMEMIDCAKALRWKDRMARAGNGTASAGHRPGCASCQEKYGACLGKDGAQ